MPAVVMAGGRAAPELTRETGLTNRAMIPVRGRPMIESVLTALRGTELVDRITVVGDLPAFESVESVGDQGGFADNLFAGLGACRGADFALISTADIPFITSEAIEDFIKRAIALDADVVYPVVDVDACYRRFPGVKRTAISIRDGKLTGGNMVLMRPETMLAQRDRIAGAYAARKSPIKLALMLGLGTTIRAAVALTVAPNLLSVSQLENAAGRLLGCRARALVSSYPEIATDIDRPSDLAAIERR